MAEGPNDVMDSLLHGAGSPDVWYRSQDLRSVVVADTWVFVSGDPGQLQGGKVHGGVLVHILPAHCDLSMSPGSKPEAGWGEGS